MDATETAFAKAADAGRDGREGETGGVGIFRADLLRITSLFSK